MRYLKIVVLSLFILLFVTACSNDSNDNSDPSTEKVTLKVADYLSPEHYISKEGAVFWMERAKELADGQLDFDYFPAEQLGNADKMLEAVKNNVADVAYTGIGYHSDQLTLSGVGELPGAFETAVEGTKAYRAVIDNFLLEEEYLKQGVRPMFAVAAAPFQIMTRGHDIQTVDDFKGLKVRSGGGAISITIQDIGATPVSMAAPELYTGLERGTIDGTVFSIASIPPYQLEAIIDNVTLNANLGSFIIPYVINEDVWQSLPENIQHALYQAGLDTEEHLAQYMDTETEETIELLKEANVDLVELSGGDVDRLNEIYEDVWVDWEEEVNSRGLDGSGAKEAFMNALQ